MRSMLGVSDDFGLVVRDEPGPLTGVRKNDGELPAVALGDVADLFDGAV